MLPSYPGSPTVLRFSLLGIDLRESVPAMSGIQALQELVPQGPLAGPVGDAVAEMQMEIVVAFSTAEHLHH